MNEKKKMYVMDISNRIVDKEDMEENTDWFEEMAYAERAVIIDKKELQQMMDECKEDIPIVLYIGDEDDIA
jgi:hypothetical protein